MVQHTGMHVDSDTDTDTDTDADTDTDTGTMSLSMTSPFFALQEARDRLASQLRAHNLVGPQALKDSWISGMHTYTRTLTLCTSTRSRTRDEIFANP